MTFREPKELKSERKRLVQEFNEIGSEGLSRMNREYKDMQTTCRFKYESAKSGGSKRYLFANDHFGFIKVFDLEAVLESIEPENEPIWVVNNKFYPYRNEEVSAIAYYERVFDQSPSNA